MMNTHGKSGISARIYTILMVTALMLSLLAITHAVAATDFAGQPMIGTPLRLERPEGLSTGAPVPVQEYYELRCRGGGLKFSYAYWGAVLAVDFVAGTQGARSRESLKPGQCSWVDRGFRRGEPTQIQFERGNVPRDDEEADTAEKRPNRKNVPKYLSSESRYWGFWVFNTGKGVMKAKDIGRHWSP